MRAEEEIKELIKKCEEELEYHLDDPMVYKHFKVMVKVLTWVLE